MGAATELNYGSHNWGAAEVATLAEELTSESAALQLLSLSGIDDDGVKSLTDADARGAMQGLNKLNLKFNRIGDRGMTSLSEALAGGALPKLTCLDLDHNQIGNVGISALAAACATGAMSQLQASSLRCLVPKP
eukprot:4149176-Prymnesium_polylepis.1